MRALDACIEYDRWASEITRLSNAIACCGCPQEWPPSVWDDEGPVPLGNRPDSPSCFHREKQVTVELGPYPDDGARRLYLSEIAARVKDCPACSRLCALIDERREARKKWGIAKRRIRAAARAAQREGMS